MGAVERFRGLRVRNGLLPTEGGEFFTTAAADGFDQRSVAMAGEVLEWRSLAIFFAHEQKGKKWREQSYPGRKFESFEVDEGAEPISGGAVSDLIMILVADDEF